MITYHLGPHGYRTAYNPTEAAACEKDGYKLVDLSNKDKKPPDVAPFREAKPKKLSKKALVALLAEAGVSFEKLAKVAELRQLWEDRDQSRMD